jgi:hypothetical protein
MKPVGFETFGTVWEAGNPLRRLTIDDLRRRRGIKWRRYPEDVLPLWIADMDATPAPAVVDAVNSAFERGDTGYPPFDTTMAKAWDQFAAERWGWRVATERTMVVPSALTGIAETLKVTTAPGDVVVVNSPGYGGHRQIAEGLGRRVVEAPLGPDHRIDVDALRAAFTDPHAGGVFACVQFSQDFQSGARGGRSDGVHHYLVAGQRSAAPVHGDVREETVLDPVPLRSSGRKVTHRDLQPGLDCQFRKLDLPCAAAVAVGPTRIGRDQEALRVRIGVPADGFSPTADRGNCERSGVVVTAHTDPAGVRGQVVDTVWDDLAYAAVLQEVV